MLMKHEGQRGDIPGTFSAAVDSADSPETMVEVRLQQYLVLKSWPLLLGAVKFILSIPTSKCMSTAISPALYRLQMKKHWLRAVT